MRTVAHLATAAALAAAAVPAAGAVQTQAPPNPVLVGVTAAGHPGYDRIVFRFSGGLPAMRRVSYVPQLIQDGSGARLPMPGRAVLQVVMSNADAHDQSGRPTVPAAATVALRNVMRIRRAGDFEAVVTYGIGLAARRPFRVSTLTAPDRLVVDVDTRFAVVSRRVWFQNLPNFQTGAQPDITPVSRLVPRAYPATGLLDRLYAGPTTAEAARGLRLVTSRSTGFSNLHVHGGVADLRLRGGCSSGGSTFTVANLMVPTLTQLVTVDAVRIRDPQGNTEPAAPGGGSIPVCLEP